MQLKNYVKTIQQFVFWDIVCEHVVYLKSIWTFHYLKTKIFMNFSYWWMWMRNSSQALYIFIYRQIVSFVMKHSTIQLAFNFGEFIVLFAICILNFIEFVRIQVDKFTMLAVNLIPTRHFTFFNCRLMNVSCHICMYTWYVHSLIHCILLYMISNQ